MYLPLPKPRRCSWVIAHLYCWLTKVLLKTKLCTHHQVIYFDARHIKRHVKLPRVVAVLVITIRIILAHIHFIGIRAIRPCFTDIAAHGHKDAHFSALAATAVLKPLCELAADIVYC